MARPFNPLMAAAFLPIADQYVGFPLLLGEAVDRIVAAMFDDDWRVWMTLDEQIKWHADYSTSLLHSLQTGGTASFVERPSTGRWYRVPKEQWWPSERLSHTLELIEGEWLGRAPEMIGGPVVVWRDDVEAFARKRLADINRRLAERGQQGVAQAPAAPPSAVQERFTTQTEWGELTAWYDRRIDSAPASGYTRKEDEQAGMAAGIGRDRTRELRKDRAPEHWHQSGRRSRNN